MPSVGFLSSRRRPSPVSTSRLSLVPLPVVSDHCRCHLVLSDWFGFLPIYLPSFTRKPPCLSSPSLPSQTVTAPPSGVSCLCLAVRSRQLVVSFRCNLHYCRYSLRRMHSLLKYIYKLPVAFVCSVFVFCFTLIGLMVIYRFRGISSSGTLKQ